MATGSMWGLIISGVLAIGSVLGIILSRMGKKEDVEQQAVSDQFKRMLDEVNYWQASASTTRTEWEARWDRQMDRCRKITDRMAGALQTLLGQLDDEHKVADHTVQEVIEAVKDHDNVDHVRTVSRP